VKFNFECEVPVVPPYRLDLTVDALRRLAANVVDVVADDGSYWRAFPIGTAANVARVWQVDGRTLRIAVSGRSPERTIPTLERMLGVGADLTEWYARAAEIPWLDSLAAQLRGLRPPRYPDLWEALAHAIIFQQISIHAAASIMRRLVVDISPAVATPAGPLHVFPSPAAVSHASDERLRAAGLSANKVAHLRSAAAAVLSKAVRESELLRLTTTADATARLCEIRGIGPWSAAVVALRGLGRLDVFPLRDSGVARSFRLLSGSPDTPVDSVLETLGPTRGMLYFHLLLGRLRNLVPE
jgi:DNA-3-methyladenine glycosylase II